MVMKGFKSFAKHIEIPLGPQYNCVLGPNGSGKCLIGNTLVYMADGALMKIKDIVNEKLKTNYINKIDDGYVATGDNTQILCLDTKSLKVTKKNIKAYVKRTSPETLLRIKTRSGREVITTTYHPLFTLNKETIKSVKAENLRQGLKIAVPRKIDLKVKTKYFYELLDLITSVDNIYVPYNEDFEKILRRLKKSTWKNTAKKINIPQNAIKGLLDKQAVNFSYLVRILRYIGLNNKAIIRRIPKIKSKTSSILCKIPWKNSPEFSRLLGYLIAEGRFPKDEDQIWFTNSEESLVEDYYNLIQKLFGLKATINEYKPNCYDVLAYSAPIRKILIKFGMSLGNTQDKKITNIFLRHSNNEELSNFLSGLYSGDGYIGKSNIEILTKSRDLGRAIENILARLGIICKSKYVIKMATNSGFEGIYKQILIYGVNNFITFHNTIKLVHGAKRKRLEGLLKVKSNPNLDLIEANSLIKRAAKELNINVKKSKKEFPRLDSYCYNQCTPSREGTKKLVNELFLPTAQEKNANCQSLLALQLISESDVYWDEITEVEKIKHKEKWVYDLCVDEHHNFIANNFFVHNSNILDALCFVLGKSSSKSLRAEKSANLIYNGGKSKKPSKSGEVSIYFDNSNKTFPTDAKEIKITRMVRHSGQSVYKINDKTRTRQEIVDLLNIAKINPDAYNIILQGDIIRFVEMHPVERRQLIEGISGISVYEEKKRKALSELQRVDERLKETEIILTERNTYLRELKKDRDQALKYKEMNDKITQNKASYLKIQLDKKEADHKELQQKIGKADAELKNINEKIGKLKQINEEKKKEIEDITADIEEKGEVEQVKLSKEVETLKIGLTKINSRIDTCKNEVNKIKQRKQDLQQSLTETGQKISGLNQQKTSLQEQIKSKQDERNEINNKLSQFRQKNKLDNVGDIEKNVEEIDKKSEELQKQIHNLREQQHNLIREKDKISHEIGFIDSKIKKVIDIGRVHKKQVEELKNKREEFKKSILELNKRLDEDSNLSLQLSNSRKKIVNSNEELSKLKARDIGRREFTYSDIAVKKILEQKNTKRGIYGTVADLGRVSSKYSLALEIAAGPRLKSIVVEDEKVASECIKYLKQNRLGIATFLPLNKIKEKPLIKKVEDLADSKGSHGLALNLVSYDIKFKNVFSYVFSNTIIADDIYVARRLGIGRAKFVTLDGDLAELSGAMHGGFRAKRKGMGFKEKDLAKDIDEYETIISTLKKTIDSLEKKKTENEQLITELRDKKANLEGDIIKTEKSLHLEPSDIDLSQQQKTEMEEKEKQAESEIQKVSQKISNVNRELAELKTEKQKLRSQISQLRNPTLLAELNTFGEKLNQLNEEIIKTNSEIKNIDDQILNIYEPEKEKTIQIVKQLDKDEEGFKQEYNELINKVGEKQAILDKKEEAAQDFRLEFKGLFEKRSKINEEISKNESIVNNKLSESRNIEIKNNTLSLKKAGISAELSGLKQEFEQYEGVRMDTTKNEQQLKSEINKFEMLREQIGSVNMRALEIYEEVETQYKTLLGKKDHLANEKEDVLVMMKEVEGKKKELFMKTLEVVNENFKKFFSVLSSKGDAYLVLEDPENPFEAGLRINVKITGQKFLDIRSLSGGEKTMTALAFIFAIQEHEPASFYVLDEVDAALDKHNSEKFAKLIRKYSDKAQYVIISHNDAVISEADNLYGISMNEEGVSKLVSLKI